MKERKPAICPITYEPLVGKQRYSKKGLRLLSPKLQVLNDLPFTVKQQRKEARLRADKLSIPGVQPKLSARLDTKNQRFELCDRGGNYILKPPHEHYSELPENEDLTMRLAAVEDLIEVPFHGLVYSSDGSFTYFIKRFDRLPRNQKLAVEDFSQLAGLTRETKYDFSMEKIIPLIEKYCTFPEIEKVTLFIRIIFNYLIGNEDMHLKNFSLISRAGITGLSPGYDFINTTLAVGNAKEEIALPLHGKKRNLTRKDLVEYYGIEKLGLNKNILNKELERFKQAFPRWKHLVDISFLSEKSKKKYLEILEERTKILNLAL